MQSSEKFVQGADVIIAKVNDNTFFNFASLSQWYVENFSKIFQLKEQYSDKVELCTAYPAGYEQYQLVSKSIVNFFTTKARVTFILNYPASVSIEILALNVTLSSSNVQSVLSSIRKQYEKFQAKLLCLNEYYSQNFCQLPLLADETPWRTKQQRLAIGKSVERHVQQWLASNRFSLPDAIELAISMLNQEENKMTIYQRAIFVQTVPDGEPVAPNLINSALQIEPLTVEWTVAKMSAVLKNTTASVSYLNARNALKCELMENISEDRLKALETFCTFWGTVGLLDINEWSKWFNVESFSLILNNRVPIGSVYSSTDDSGTLNKVNCDQAFDALKVFFKNYTTFSLDKGTSFVSFIKSGFTEDDKAPSFYLLKFILHSFVGVCHFAFSKEISPSQRDQIITDMKNQLSKLPLISEKNSNYADQHCSNSTEYDANACFLLTRPLEKLLVRHNSAPVFPFASFQDSEMNTWPSNVTVGRYFHFNIRPDMSISCTVDYEKFPIHETEIVTEIWVESFNEQLSTVSKQRAEKLFNQPCETKSKTAFIVRLYSRHERILFYCTTIDGTTKREIYKEDFQLIRRLVVAKQVEQFCYHKHIRITLRSPKEIVWKSLPDQTLRRYGLRCVEAMASSDQAQFYFGNFCLNELLHSCHLTTLLLDTATVTDGIINKLLSSLYYSVMYVLKFKSGEPIFRQTAQCVHELFYTRLGEKYSNCVCIVNKPLLFEIWKLFLRRFERCEHPDVKWLAPMRKRLELFQAGGRSPALELPRLFYFALHLSQSMHYMITFAPMTLGDIDLMHEEPDRNLLRNVLGAQWSKLCFPLMVFYLCPQKIYSIGFDYDLDRVKEYHNVTVQEEGTLSSLHRQISLLDEIELHQECYPLNGEELSCCTNCMGSYNFCAEVATLHDSYMDCFVCGIYKSLCAEFPVYESDIRFAIESHCVEGTLELDITEFLHTECHHLVDYQNMSDSDDLCCFRLMDIAVEKWLTVNSSFTGRTSPLFNLPDCDSVGQEKARNLFQAVLQNYFQTIPTCTDYLICKPLQNDSRLLHSLDEGANNSDVESLSTAELFSSNDSGHPPDMLFADNLSSGSRWILHFIPLFYTSQSVAVAVRIHMKVLCWARLVFIIVYFLHFIWIKFVSLSLQLDDISEREFELQCSEPQCYQHPIFLQISCSVFIGNKQYNFRVDSLPTCIVDLFRRGEINDWSNDMECIRVVLQFNILTLDLTPLEVGFWSRNTVQREIVNNMNWNRKKFYDGKVLVNASRHLYVLPTAHKSALISFYNRVVLLIRSEIICGYSRLPIINDAVIEAVVKHIKCVLRTPLNLEISVHWNTIPLLFVLDCPESLKQFLDRLMKLNVSNCIVKRCAEDYFIIREYEYPNPVVCRSNDGTLRRCHSFSDISPRLIEKRNCILKNTTWQRDDDGSNLSYSNLNSYEFELSSIIKSFYQLREEFSNRERQQAFLFIFLFPLLQLSEKAFRNGEMISYFFVADGSGDAKSDDEIEYLVADRHYGPAYFACPVVAYCWFPLHPCCERLTAATLFRRVLCDLFGHTDDQNVFLYKNSEGNVYYIRVYDEFKTEAYRMIKRCNKQFRKELKMAKIRLLRSEKFLNYTFVTVHGIEFPGLEVVEKVIKPLRAAFDNFIIRMLHLLCKNCDDATVHFVPSPLVKQHLPAFSYYLRQILGGAGHIPCYRAISDSLWKINFAPQAEPNDSFICILHSGSDGIALVTQSFVDYQGIQVNFANSNCCLDVRHGYKHLVQFLDNFEELIMNAARISAPPDAQENTTDNAVENVYVKFVAKFHGSYSLQTLMTVLIQAIKDATFDLLTEYSLLTLPLFCLFEDHEKLKSAYALVQEREFGRTHEPSLSSGSSVRLITVLHDLFSIPRSLSDSDQQTSSFFQNDAYVNMHYWSNLLEESPSKVVLNSTFYDIATKWLEFGASSHFNNVHVSSFSLNVGKDMHLLIEKCMKILKEFSNSNNHVLTFEKLNCGKRVPYFLLKLDEHTTLFFVIIIFNLGYTAQKHFPFFKFDDKTGKWNFITRQRLALISILANEIKLYIYNFASEFVDIIRDRIQAAVIEVNNQSNLARQISTCKLNYQEDMVWCFFENVPNRMIWLNPVMFMPVKYGGKNGTVMFSKAETVEIGSLLTNYEKTSFCAAFVATTSSNGLNQQVDNFVHNQQIALDNYKFIDKLCKIIFNFPNESSSAEKFVEQKELESISEKFLLVSEVQLPILFDPTWRNGTVFSLDSIIIVKFKSCLRDLYNDLLTKCHFHSFVHDFHLQTLTLTADRAEEGEETAFALFPEGFNVQSFLLDFYHYYAKHPIFSDSILLNPERVTFKLPVACSSEDIFDSMLEEHSKFQQSQQQQEKHDFRVVKMGENSGDKQHNGFFLSKWSVNIRFSGTNGDEENYTAYSLFMFAGGNFPLNSSESETFSDQLNVNVFTIYVKNSRRQMSSHYWQIARFQHRLQPLLQHVENWVRDNFAEMICEKQGGKEILQKNLPSILQEVEFSFCGMKCCAGGMFSDSLREMLIETLADDQVFFYFCPQPVRCLEYLPNDAVASVKEQLIQQRLRFYAERISCSELEYLLKITHTVSASVINSEGNMLTKKTFSQINKLMRKLFDKFSGRLKFFQNKREQRQHLVLMNPNSDDYFIIITIEKRPRNYNILAVFRSVEANVERDAAYFDQFVSSSTLWKEFMQVEAECFAN
ncbi:hypothetical protein Tsp_11664 [Trichinella spiralis]|uniref:hypothetical protein n=1 Tax=Trichinella spiralis TaxID=6334 RepID=UPI0001EFE33A|nr:hypothetical protein Tsp_11664 [Trichinella spiralis]